MQYILTEEEYRKLIDNKNEAFRSYSKKLFQFCWDASQNIPIKRSWDEGKISPWGCIYDRDGILYMEYKQPEDAINSTYCDNCPSKTFCPQGKSFSK